MRLLLDTHVYLWVRLDHPRLPKLFRDAIADVNNVKYVSSVSAAEIAVKRAVGKLESDGAIDWDIAGTGLDALDFTYRHAQVLDTLPLHHRDPFDRMLIAQAIAEDLVFLTVDAQCAAYDVRRLAWPLECPVQGEALLKSAGTG
jgi:PIN domain nuclease of toxin-antitoxin system